ncbi:MAG TPA: tetratricopeptide repeat protein [bacterium]|jgi:outer membrane protein assembly factor BamD (BamD/ComL family)
MTSSTRPIRLALLLILLGLLWTVVQAQVKITPVPMTGKPPSKVVSDEAVMAERARRAEAAGDYARALSIWQELANRSPWNVEAVQGVPRDMIVLKKYDDAERFLNEWIHKNELRGQVISPMDPTSTYALELQLGQLALARGDEKKAWEVWNAALKEQGKTFETIRALVMVLQQNRRWEDSEKLIRDFRKESKQPAYMALELALGLRGQMDYAGATEQLLVYAENTPASWQVAMNYLEMFPDDSTVSPKVSAVLRKAVQRDRKNPILWRMIAGYAHKTGHPDESLEATIAADSLSHGNGAETLGQAQQFLTEKSVAVARRGFQKVLSWKPPADVAARAELGLAKCLEALDQAGEAKRAYESFVSMHGTAREADEARFRIAEIMLNHDHNPTDALGMYKGLWQRATAIPRAQIGLRIGDCHAFMRDFDDAVKAWSDVVHLNGTAMNEDATQALLRIAHANLWRDSLAGAMAILDSIQTGSPMNSGFNEAVLYSGVLGEGGFHGAVRVFAEGDYAEFCNQDSLAASKYDSAASLAKTGKLAEWARYSQALTLRDARQPQRAVAVLDTFIANFPESVDVDRAEYMRAVIRMEDLHDDKTALTEFQNFLAARPRSIYLEEARKKARMLTGRIS